LGEKEKEEGSGSVFGVATTQAPSPFYSNAALSMKIRGTKYVSLSPKVNSIALVSHKI
jgi:hypothetical protein